MYCELPDGLVNVWTPAAGMAPLGDAPVNESYREREAEELLLADLFARDAFKDRVANAAVGLAVHQHRRIEGPKA